jgi:hypothetical protein
MPLAGFAGISFPQAGIVPPDANAAIGPGNVVEVVNSTIAVYNRSGARLSQQSLRGFFARAGAASTLFDTTVLYDDQAGRFVVAGLEPNDAARTTFLDFAVSNTSDPTRGFGVMRRINVGERTAAGQALRADFTRAGWNADAYVVTVNMFTFGTEIFDHVQVVALPKTGALSGIAANLKWTRTDRPDDFGLTPATLHDAKPGGPMWLLAPNDGSTLQLLRMTNLQNGVPSFTTIEIGIPSYGLPPAAAQPGAGGIETGDDRILNADARSGLLVAAQNVGIGGRVRARWYEFNLRGVVPVLAQSGEIDPGPAIDTYYPSIAVTAAGDIGLTYLQSSARQFLSMYVTTRAATDAPGTTAPGVLVQAGQAAYRDSFYYPKPPYRAGDFSSIQVDPLDGATFWAANQYATATALNNWGTWIAHFAGWSPRAPATVNVQVTPSAVAVGGSLTLTGALAGLPLVANDRVMIDWGDGTPPTVLVLPVGVNSFQSVHVFRDPPPFPLPFHFDVIRISVLDNQNDDMAFTTAPILITW